MTMYYTPSEEQYLEQRRSASANASNEKFVQGERFVECSDGVWRTEASRIAFEASRAIQPPEPQ